MLTTSSVVVLGCRDMGNPKGNTTHTPLYAKTPKTPKPMEKVTKTFCKQFCSIGRFLGLAIGRDNGRSMELTLKAVAIDQIQ